MWLFGDTSLAIARAVVWGSRLVILDEPTAALGVDQTENVHKIIKKLRDQGVGVVLITHNMNDVFALADKVIVLRQGYKNAEMLTSSCSHDDVVKAITGSSELGKSKNENNN